jgi:hypothetical protein
MDRNEKKKTAKRTLGTDALAHAFRSAALRCTLKYGLTAEDIEEAAGTVMRECDSYQNEDQDAA